MGIGHLGIGLGLKKANSRINLGLLFFVAFFADFLLGIFILMGLEQAHIPPDYEELRYLYFEFPYSHGLAATLFWSALIFLLVKLFWPKDKGNSTLVATILAIAAFSHFVLDWLVHIPEIPLLGPESYKMGLGLWDTLGLALFIEGLLVAGGLIIYFRTTSGQGFGARYGLLILIGLFFVMQFMGQLFGPPPPNATGPAISWIAMPLIISGLAFWLDKKRTPKQPDSD